MTPRTLSLLNIFLAVLVFPAAALVAKDVIALKYAIRGAAIQGPASVPPERPVGIEGYSVIVEKPVFPSKAQKLVPVAVERGPVADPSAILSGLKLIGTYVGPRSFAVFIKTAGGVEAAFEPGEEVFGQGVLKEVERDRALIVSGGVPVTVRMPEEDLPRAVPLTLMPLTTETDGRQAPGEAAPASTGAFRGSRQTGENEWVVSQEAVLSALDDMGQVLSAARLTPVMEGAAATGFLVTEIRPRGIMDAIGLKNGDILKRVNGFEITSPERAVQVLSALKGETSFDLDIVRGSVPMSFHYDVR